MEGDQFAYHGKADTAATCRRFGASAQAHVRLPDPIPVGGGNSRALVLDPEAHAAAGRRRGAADGNGLSGRTVLRRVVEQVEQNLAQRVSIRRHNQALGGRDAHRHSSRARKRREHFDGVADFRVEVERRRLDPIRSLLGARKV